MIIIMSQKETRKKGEKEGIENKYQRRNGENRDVERQSDQIGAER